MAMFCIYDAYNPFGMRLHVLDRQDAWLEVLTLNLTISLAATVFAIIAALWVAVIATSQQTALQWLTRLWAPFWAAFLVALSVFFAWYVVRFFPVFEFKPLFFEGTS
jgi:ABC-type amino acid transport system permease subunit